jgi:TP53 regulating kinase-like protein
MRIIQRGAEAVLYLDPEGRLVKDRVRKGYRIRELDEGIRTARTRNETRLLDKARRLGAEAPAVMETSGSRIVMEHIGGPKVKDVLDRLPEGKRKEVCGLIGSVAARLHSAGIVHGDLTTSNMLLKEGKLYIIDFGLGRVSQKVEDQAVDLFLLREALESAHFAVLEKSWKNIIKVYKQEYSKSNGVLARLEKIDKRRRYKSKGE